MKYHDVIYRNYPKSTYPEKLAKYLDDKYLHHNSLIVDLGCGDGTYVRGFAKLGNVTYGLDLNNTDYPIDLAKDKFPYKDGMFDVVFTKSTIEHLDNPWHFLKECNRILRPGGKLLVLTPSWEYNYKWFYDDPTHVRPFHRKGLQDALKLADFSVVNVKYFYHLPCTWDNPFMTRLVSWFARLVPDSWRWADKEETRHRVFIRFSKEVQLLAVAGK